MAGGSMREWSGRAAAALVAAWVAAGAGCIIVVDDNHDDAEYAAWRAARGHYIGVTLDSVARETASQLALDRDQVTLITHVYTGTPAERAGLQKYDVITSIDGAAPASPASVRAAIRAKRAGEELRLGVVRAGQPLDITVTIEDN